MSRQQRCCWPLCLEISRPGLPICEMHAVRAHSVMDVALRDQPEQVKPTPVPNHMRAGTVYYLQVGDRVKIGWAADLEKRLKSYPPGTEVLAYEPGTMADEAAVHQRCTPWRCDGREWYTPGPGIDKVIMEARQRHSLLRRLEHDALTFAPRPGWPGPPQVAFSN